MERKSLLVTLMSAGFESDCEGASTHRERPPKPLRFGETAENKAI